MKAVTTAVALGLVFAAGFAGATPIELLTNGSFETGNPTGWTTSGLGTTGYCGGGVQGRDWNISASPSATGCSSPGNPADGTYAAYVMNDGGVINATYTLSQSFVVPTGLTAASLSWSDSSVSTYFGAARVFSVDLLEGSTLLANIFAYTVPFNDGNPTWDARSFDVSALLSANIGDTLTLRFSNFIPQVWTGPAGLGVDNVSLSASVSTVPEPGTLSLLGLGLAGAAFSRRRTRA